MLSPSASNAVQLALASLEAATARQERAAADASGGLTGWWADAIGADSAAAALRTNAHAARVLLDTMKARAARLDTDDQARQLVRDVGGYVDTRGIEAAASFLSPGTAAVEVGGGMARDLASTAATVGAGWLAVLKASPYLLAGLALLWLWSWAPKRAKP